MSQSNQTNEPYLQDDSYYDASAGPTLRTDDPLNSTPLMTPEEEAKQREDWRLEFQKTEEEIHTLRQVLASKIRRAHELKRLLGIGALTEIKEDFRHGMESIRSTDSYQKTTAVVKAAKDKTSSSLTTASSKLSQKWGVLRNSNTFKSFEGKMGSAYSNVKNRISGSASVHTFGEAPTVGEAAGDTANPTLADDELDTSKKVSS